jgi:hopanoid biosynthesis associated membrane protein HpnM
MSMRYSRGNGILRLAFSAVLLASALAGRANASDASAPIEQLDAGLLQAMKLGKSAPFRQRYDLLAPLVGRAVALDLILQNGVGAGWTSVPPDQQAALTSAFQRYSIATYVAHFDEYGGERFELLPPATGASGGPIVQVKIVPGKPGDEAHVLGYSMRQVGGAWKAVDVTADSTISQVVAQQAEIRSLFSRYGTSGLLARLQEKTAQLSGGALR